MKRRNFILNAGAATVVAATTGFTNANQTRGLKSGEVLHTVIFDLKHPAGSAEAKKIPDRRIQYSDKHTGCRGFPGIPPM